MDNLPDSPKVEISPSGGRKEQFSIRKLLRPKTVFLGLGVILLIELIFAIKTLTAPVSPASPTTQPKSQLGQVSLSLEAVGRDFKAGGVVTVNVRVNTGGHSTDGVDLVLKFDPKILEATSGALIKTHIYPDYPQMRVDQSSGLIQISGISGIQGGTFKGEGVLATINFKAKAAGKTTLTIDHTKGQTNDSNVVERETGMDILEDVNNLSLTIK